MNIKPPRLGWLYFFVCCIIFTMRKKIVQLLLPSMLTVFCLVCACLTGDKQYRSAERERVMRAASRTPFGRYPSKVTYTLGKLSASNRSNMPSGDSYQDNAYTRYVEKRINVVNKDVFELSDNNYNDRVSISIASGDIPDVCLVNDDSTLRRLVSAGLVEDLTTAYRDCASSRIKKIYESYGDEIFEPVTFNGRLYALPETNIDNGPSLLWLRQDWMDELGLSAPVDISDVRTILKAFKRAYPDSTGLITTPELTGDAGYSQEYQTDIIFAAFSSYPGQWYKKKGQYVYGSVQPETKEALSYLRDMYKEGTLDRDFFVRDSGNLIDLVTEGKCGAFFGPWWAPNNPLIDSVKKDSRARWMPYLIKTDSQGFTSFPSQNPNGKFVVVRKGYKHPEVVMKIVSVLFDDLPYGKPATRELEDYYINNVDPTARPLSVNVDFKNALTICYNDLTAVLHGKMKASSLDLLEGSYYEACRDYLKSGKDSDKGLYNWAAYTSRITACRAFTNNKVREVNCLHNIETDAMKKRWWKLKELEQKTFLTIVTGESPLSSFDEFTKEWYRQGGGLITSEVRSLYK